MSLFLIYFFYFLWFIGRKNLGRSYALTPKALKLKTHGLYKKILHPLYFSQTFILFFFVVFSGNNTLWILFIPILFIQIFRAKSEEKLLEEKFGNKYLEYKKKTWF